MPICAGRPNGTERIPVSRLLRLIWVRELDGASPSATACRSHSTQREDANDGNIRFHQGAFPAVIATVGSAPSSALITLAFSEFHCPRMRGLQGITAC